MDQAKIDVLKSLIETPCPTGSESKGAMLLGKYIEGATGIKPTIDLHGNLHAIYDVGAKTTVMIEGHGDEIGYMVSYVDERGFVYFQALGGIVVPLSAAERVVILSKNGPVNGVMGTRPPHLMKGDEKKHVAPDDLSKLPCDIGASSKAEALEMVSIGDAAVVATGWTPLAGSKVSGRGFDDRSGTFAMCETFIRLVTSQEKPKVNIHYVSSVCEEIGLVGGRLASYNVNPTIGICCDVAFSSDTPGDNVKMIGDIRLGGGAVLAIGPIYHKGLIEHFRATAKKENVSIQERAVPRGTGNNGWAMKMERGGTAVVQIAIPLRYMHSPVEVVDLRDIESVIDLVYHAILGLDDSFNLLPEQP